MSKPYWDSEKLFFDGDDYFNQLKKDIQSATTLITVEMYIFSNDELGNSICNELIRARNRGVKVQILIDGVGSFDFDADSLKRQGIQLKFYHPLPFYHPYYGEMNWRKKLQALLRRISNLNRRDHRKIITIDSNVMYLGSFNITAEHTHLHKEEKWKDMGVRVQGEKVQHAVLQFQRLWGLREFYQYRKKLKLNSWKKNRYSPLRLNYSLFIRQILYLDLLKRISKAKRRIWIMTPYFIPQSNFIRKLAQAAKRGTDVRLMISAKTDVSIFKTLRFFYYPYLIKKGVKIYHFDSTILHAKNLIIDDWMTIGSSNLNHRSLLHDLEVDLVIQSHDNKQLVSSNFIQELGSMNPVTIEDLKQRTLFDKFLSRLLFLFRYWF